MTDDHKVTSDEDSSYNCVAFAAGDTALWWEPLQVPRPGFHWPKVALHEGGNDDIAALKRCFAAIGYEECEGGEWEAGHRKVALYGFTVDDWQHAAVQQNSGEWKSKLGDGYDIEHKTPECVCGPRYGNVLCFMKCKIADERKPEPS